MPDAAGTMETASTRRLIGPWALAEKETTAVAAAAKAMVKQCCMPGSFGGPLNVRPLPPPPRGGSRSISKTLPNPRMARRPGWKLPRQQEVLALNAAVAHQPVANQLARAARGHSRHDECVR